VDAPECIARTAWKRARVREAYRDILDTVSQHVDGTAAANELARLALQLGVTETELFV